MDELSPRERELLDAILLLGENQIDILIESGYLDDYDGSHAMILEDVRALRMRLGKQS